jgi:DNA-directed RNA polymerase specialized sigma24 family protein
MKENLTQVILAFKEGIISRDRVIGRISIFSYNYLHKKFKDDPDIASEIFCEIYRRIPRMIDSFVYRGSTFEVYLHMSIRRATCTYFYNSKRNRDLRNYSEKMYFDELETEPDDRMIPADDTLINPEYSKYFCMDDKRKIPIEYLRRRLLCLIFKNAWFCSPSHIRKAAEVTGVGYNWLYEKIEFLRASMHSRSRRHSRLSRLRKENMARAHIYQNAGDSCFVTEERQLYQQRCSAARRRMRSLSRELYNVPMAPTHTEIAKVLAIPKGSVDSGLHYLRTALIKNRQEDRSS